MNNFVVTYHAGERFLQRVLEKTNYTKKDILYAMQIISNDVKNIVTNRKRFILPSFSKFNVIVKEKTIVTIIKKN